MKNCGLLTMQHHQHCQGSTSLFGALLYYCHSNHSYFCCDVFLVLLVSAPVCHCSLAVGWKGGRAGPLRLGRPGLLPQHHWTSVAPRGSTGPEQICMRCGGFPPAYGGMLEGFWGSFRTPKKHHEHKGFGKLAMPIQAGSTNFPSDTGRP